MLGYKAWKKKSFFPPLRFLLPDRRENTGIQMTNRNGRHGELSGFEWAFCPRDSNRLTVAREEGIFVPIFQMEKLGLREVKKFLQIPQQAVVPSQPREVPREAQTSPVGGGDCVWCVHRSSFILVLK